MTAETDKRGKPQTTGKKKDGNDGTKTRDKFFDKGFYRTILIFAICGMLGTIGYFVRDLVEERYLYGTVYVDANDTNLKKHCDVSIRDIKGKNLRSFKLVDKSLTRLPHGTYVIQAYYPNENGSRDLVFEDRFELTRRSTKTITLKYHLPNAVKVKLQLPKREFVRGELISFWVATNKDGFVWIFSPESPSIPNLLFPHSPSQDNQIEAGIKLVFPPSQKDAYTLTTNNARGEETIVAVVTETNDQQFALACLKKVVTSMSSKVALTYELPWGYDKQVIKVD